MAKRPMTQKERKAHEARVVRVTTAAIGTGAVGLTGALAFASQHGLPFDRLSLVKAAQPLPPIESSDLDVAAAETIPPDDPLQPPAQVPQSAAPGQPAPGGAGAAGPPFQAVPAQPANTAPRPPGAPAPPTTALPPAPGAPAPTAAPAPQPTGGAPAPPPAPQPTPPPATPKPKPPAPNPTPTPKGGGS